MKKLTFSPSLMCGNHLNIEKDLQILRKHNFDYVHLDIMDGHFVPNITFGYDLVNAVQGIPRDIHLMVEHPEVCIRSLKLQDGDLVTLHIETKGDIKGVIEDIRSAGAQVGLALSPSTPVDAVEPFIKHIDHILIMTVHPGFSGAPLIEGSYGRVAKLVRMVKASCSDVTVGVDGAIGFPEIELFSALGVTHFVLGTTALFRGELQKQAELVTNYKLQIERLRE